MLGADVHTGTPLTEQRSPMLSCDIVNGVEGGQEREKPPMVYERRRRPLLQDLRPPGCKVALCYKAIEGTRSVYVLLI